MTFPTANVTGISGLWQHSNSLTDGWFSLLIPMSLFVIIFIYMKMNRTNYYTTQNCFLISSFISFVFSALIWAVGLLSGGKVIIFLILTLISALFAYLQD